MLPWGEPKQIPEIIDSMLQSQEGEAGHKEKRCGRSRNGWGEGRSVKQTRSLFTVTSLFCS